MKPVSSEKRASQSPTCCHISRILGTFSRAGSAFTRLYERRVTSKAYDPPWIYLAGTAEASEKCSDDKFIVHLSTYEPNKTNNVEESKNLRLRPHEDTWPAIFLRPIIGSCLTIKVLSNATD